MIINFYSQKNCGSCIATERALNKAGLDYEYIDVTEDEEQKEWLRAKGFSQMPVIITDEDDGEWSGYRPDRIRNLSQD